MTADFTPLEAMVREYHAWRLSPEYHEDNDWDSYIMECAVECVFGDDIFARLNRHTDIADAEATLTEAGAALTALKAKNPPPEGGGSNG